MKKLRKILFLLLLGFGAFTVSFAQATKSEKKAAKAAEVKRLVTSQNFIFKPEYNVNVSPEQKLFYDYGLAVSKDTLELYLPSSSTPTGNKYGGWNVDSYKFDYSYNADKKGIWHVFIRPKDFEADVKFTLTIEPNGSGTLAYFGHIYFTGHIEEPIPDKLASN